MSDWQAQNALQWEKLHFALDQRERPAMLWITCDAFQHRKQLIQRAKIEFPQFQHTELDLGTYAGQSLGGFLSSSIPATQEPEGSAAAVMIHLSGLETLVASREKETCKAFFHALNFERESLFHHMPAHIVFWTESFSQIQAQRAAPDFWDWLSNKLSFDSPPASPAALGEGWLDTDSREVPGLQREELINQTVRLLQSLDSPDTPEQDKVSLLAAISENYYRLQDYPQALGYLLELEILAGDTLSLQLRDRLGQLFYSSGDYKEALARYAANLPRYREIGDKKGEGATLNNLSQIYHARGDYETALPYLEQALAVFREIGAKKEEGTTLNNLSQIYDALDDYATALRYLEQSLAIRLEIGDKKGEGTTLNNLSQVYAARGDYATALRYLEQSLAIAREIGDKQGESTTLGNIGSIHQARGTYAEALRFFKQDLKICREIGDKAGEGATLNRLGGIYGLLGNYQRALQYLAQSLVIMRETRDKRGEGVTLNNIGGTYLALNEYESAMTYLEQSLRIRREIGDKGGEGTTLNTIGLVFQMQGDVEKALRYLEESLAIRREIGDIYRMATTLQNMAVIVFQHQDKPEEAIPMFIQAYQLFQQISSPNEKVPMQHLQDIKQQIGEARYQEILSQLQDR